MMSLKCFVFKVYLSLNIVKRNNTIIIIVVYILNFIILLKFNVKLQQPSLVCVVIIILKTNFIFEYSSVFLEGFSYLNKIHESRKVIECS